MSKFKPGDMAKTRIDARFPTWSNRTVCIVSLFPVAGVPRKVQAQHSQAVEWYEIELIDGLGGPDLKNSYISDPRKPVDGIVCPDTHLIPLDPPKGDHIPPAVRTIFKPKRQVVKA